jgi:hypothetical protein
VERKPKTKFSRKEMRKMSHCEFALRSQAAWDDDFHSVMRRLFGGMPVFEKSNKGKKNVLNSVR